MTRRLGVLLGAAVLVASAASLTHPVAAQAVAPAVGDTLRANVLVASFDDARAVAADPSGTLYVADQGLDAVVSIRPDGSGRQVVGGPGFASGTFDGPADVDPTNGLALWVADEGNGRVQQFSRRFRFLAALPIPGDPARAAGAPRFATDEASEAPVGDGRPVALVTGPDRSLYVLEATSGTVQVWSDQLQFRYALGASGRSGVLYEPIDLTWHQDRLLVLDRRPGEVAAARGAQQRTVLQSFDGLGTRAATVDVPLRRDGDLPRALAAAGDRIAVASAGQIGLLNRATSTWQVLVWAGDPIRDIALHGDRLWVLTARGLWSHPIER